MTKISLRYMVSSSSDRFWSELYPLVLYRHIGTQRKYLGMFGPVIDSWLKVKRVESPEEIESLIRADAAAYVYNSRKVLLRDSWVPVKFSVSVTVGDDADGDIIEISREDI